jgi:hypothetical protein
MGRGNPPPKHTRGDQMLVEEAKKIQKPEPNVEQEEKEVEKKPRGRKPAHEDVTE